MLRLPAKVSVENCRAISRPEIRGIALMEASTDSVMIRCGEQPEYSFVIPTYNEIERLPKSLERLTQLCAERGSRAEFVIIDDGSCDGTSEFLEDYCTHRANVVLIRNGRNFGKGYSIRRGVHACTGRIIVTLDADFCIPTAELEKLIEQVEHGADVSIASRYVDAFVKTSIPFIRRVLSIGFNRFVRTLLRLSYKDTQCGFKASVSSAVKRIASLQRINGWAADAELLAIAARLSLKVRELGIEIHHDELGSKVNLLRDTFTMFWDVLRVRWYLTTNAYGLRQDSFVTNIRNAEAKRLYGPLNSLAYWRRFSPTVVLAGITLLGLVLRIFYLGDKSLWVDEAGSVVLARLTWSDFGRSMWQGEMNMFFYYFLLRFWILFGTSEFWIRLLSVLPGIASIPLIFALGKRLLGAKTGFFAALLLSLNACHVAYSQEARAYSMAVFFSLASTWFFISAVLDGRRKNWIGYVVTATLGLYCHFFFAFVIASQYCSVMFLPRRNGLFRKMIWSGLAISLFFVPAMTVILTKEHGQIDVIKNLRLLDLYHLIAFLTSHGGKVLGNLLLCVELGLAIRVISYLAKQLRQRGKSADIFCTGLLVIWFCLPILITFVISFQKNIFYYRYLLICLPPLLLLIANGLDRLPRKALIPISLMVSIFSLGTVERYYGQPKENWRAATEQLVLKQKPGDELRFYPAYARVPFEYYRQRVRERSNHKRSQYPANHPVQNTGGDIWILWHQNPNFHGSFTTVRNEVPALYAEKERFRFQGVALIHFVPDLKTTADAEGSFGEKAVQTFLLAGEIQKIMPEPINLSN